MKRTLLISTLALAASSASADTKTAASLCAEAASKVIGDTSYSLEEVHQPMTLMPRYRIELQSENNHGVTCSVSANRLQGLAINGKPRTIPG